MRKPELRLREFPEPRGREIPVSELAGVMDPMSDAADLNV